VGRVCAGARPARASRGRFARFLLIGPSGAGGIILAAGYGVESRQVSVEQLWSIEDGAVCLLVERDAAPRFEICVVHGEHVVRQNRLYARGSALMLAETWRGNLSRVVVPRPSAAE
jgi:hypothetical protein